MAQQRRRSGAAAVDDRLSDLATEVLECRDLRHAWPRGSKVLTPTKYRAGKVVEAAREMECIGKCGTVRVERFDVFADGRLQRQGKPTYRRLRPYLIKSEPGETRPPVDTESVRFALLARMYPDLAW